MNTQERDFLKIISAALTGQRKNGSVFIKSVSIKTYRP